MRRTKIVATVGPACKKKKDLRDVILGGADVLRINASHTKPSELGPWIDHIRKVASGLKKVVAIMVDLQGPRVRTGSLKGSQNVLLKNGALVWVEVSNRAGDAQVITTQCREICKMVKVGDSVLIDNGSVLLKVVKNQIKKQRFQCRVLTGGILGENKGINLPNAPETLPALTRNDRESLKIAIKHKVEYVALSFVRSDKDVMTVQRLIKAAKSNIPIIAKIEKPSAVYQIRSILLVADAIMVARGDLGIELGIEKVPVFQKRIIETANHYGVPVITATQMLESMIVQAHPTRAEVSDIANAIFDGTDAVMLSGETAIGKHPVKAIRLMSKIVCEAEKHRPVFSSTSVVGDPLHMGSPIHAITRAARAASKNLGAKAIVAFTTSWKTAVLISKLGPKAIVIALTSNDETLRRLALLRGVFPAKMKFSNNTDKLFRDGDRVILKQKLLKKGDPVVVVTGRQTLSPGARYTVNIHEIGNY